jgi:CheY-like chemotaxis protein
MASILVIEDEPILRQLMVRELVGRGHVVHAAENGDEGWKLIRQLKPALILLDLLMPGMSGYDVLESLRAEPTLCTIPCIVLSNSGQIDDLDRAYSVGADQVLIKAEFNPAELVGIVEKYVGGRIRSVVGGGVH